ncbi:MAG: class I SAM-dependent methyltransferase [Lachnospiraceae bacterium]|nr:class I SAM-dependent methyltransferase [Lachnospiraceae bacterium]
MRLNKQIENLDYNETKRFFEKRAGKYNSERPYTVTMYQDNNPELVRKRNREELEKLYPMLHIDNKSRVLDVACGIGRWADALETDIAEYCGIDFSEGLIELAKERNKKEYAEFYCGSILDIGNVLKENKKGKYNVILMLGILMYLNDSDLQSVLTQVENACEQHAVICIREPIAFQERLTLKNFYSDELKDDYNAIYRTKEEVKVFLDKTLLDKGFRVREEDFLFPNELNNRKETSQYYFIVER